MTVKYLDLGFLWHGANKKKVNTKIKRTFPSLLMITLRHFGNVTAFRLYQFAGFVDLLRSRQSNTACECRQAGFDLRLTFINKVGNKKYVG